MRNARNLWQRVLSEGRLAADTEEIMVRGQDEVVRAKRLVSLLGVDAASDGEAVQKFPAMCEELEQVFSETRPLPTLLKELQALGEEAAKTIADELLTLCQKLLAYCEPRSKAPLSSMVSWFEGLWPQTSKLSEYIPNLLEPPTLMAELQTMSALASAGGLTACGLRNVT